MDLPALATSLGANAIAAHTGVRALVHGSSRSLHFCGQFGLLDSKCGLQANELFVGRMAQLGFAAALIGEAITGKGPLEQLGLETGVPLGEIEPLLAVSILFTFFAAINEGSGRFVADDE